MTYFDMKEFERQSRQQEFFDLLRNEFSKFEVEAHPIDHYITVIHCDHIPNEDFKTKVQNMFAGHWGFEYKLVHGN